MTINKLSALVLPFLLVGTYDRVQDDCLSGSHYGNYRDGSSLKAVYVVDANCATTVSTSFHSVQVRREIQQLVWLEQEQVSQELLVKESGLDSFLEGLSSHSIPPTSQIIMGSGLQYEILYQSPTASLISLDAETARNIDQLGLPRFWKSTLLPTSPVKFHPVDQVAIDRLRKILSNLTYDPVVESIVQSISIPQMRNDIRYLTGEESNIISRHSFSDGARVAAQWIKARFEECGAICELWPFREGFSPNVVCRFSPVQSSNNTVLISAHYDSRGSFGSTRAPGADDDGSGTTSIVALARAIARKRIRFHSNVEFVAFSGEEQGLIGSRAYARYLRSQNTSLSMVVQADMLAYRKPGEDLQLALPDLITTPEVAELVGNVTAFYSPELTFGLTPACCSDHQSFIEQGYPATQLFERNGPIADPMYHNSGDLSDREGYDFDQLKGIAKVQFASLLHVAGYEIAK